MSRNDRRSSSALLWIEIEVTHRFGKRKKIKVIDRFGKFILCTLKKKEKD